MNTECIFDNIKKSSIFNLFWFVLFLKNVNKEYLLDKVNDGNQDQSIVKYIFKNVKIVVISLYADKNITMFYWLEDSLLVT